LEHERGGHKAKGVSRPIHVWENEKGQDRGKPKSGVEAPRTGMDRRIR